ncbi:hypothetical protein KA005_04960 [bacterium]|nr:hypothetical protein [bacterium]
MIRVLIGFLPWISFAILPTSTLQQLDIAIAVALILTIATNFGELKKCFVLPVGTIIFFIFCFIAITVFKSLWVMSYLWLFAGLVLLLIALVSLLIRKPFTMQYAKLKTPKDKWQDPLFIKINYILTGMWSAIFLLRLILSAINAYSDIFTTLSFNIIANGLLVLAVIFTAWFPQWYKHRQQQLKQGSL